MAYRYLPSYLSPLVVGLSLLSEGRAIAQPIVPAADGTATVVTPRGDRWDIQGGTQAGRNLFHSFQEFNVPSQQTANFLARPGIDNILGRVTGGVPSIIDGTIQVTGGAPNFYLVNPAGVVFGQGATLNVPASFSATTASGIGFADGQWFQSAGENRYETLVETPSQFGFLAGQTGTILNAGTLSVGAGQSINLIGNTVMNTGRLSAPGGQITLAAIAGDRLVRLSQPGHLLSVELPLSDRGQLHPTLPAASLPDLLTGGTVSTATGVTIESGVVKLTRSGQAIPSEPGFLISDAGSTLSADAIAGGDGGRILMWADDSLRFSGTATARSALGNGGFIETSARQDVTITGSSINASAPQGQAGTWLLDPVNITIGAQGPVTPAAIAAQLNNGTNVTISTAAAGSGNGDITLQDSINQTGGGNASLTLITRRFGRSNNVQINLSSTGGLTFNLNQVNPEPNPSVSSIQNALDAIGTVAGPRTINLGSGTYLFGPVTTSVNGLNAPISITKSVTINGNGPDVTRLDGGQTAQIFTIGNRATVQLNHLSLINGRAESGGAILNQSGSTLTLNNTRLSNNLAKSQGGGIHNLGTLTINDSLLENNQAQYGGALKNYGRLFINNSLIQNNRASEGGGLYQAAGQATITASTFLSNVALLGSAMYQADGRSTIAQSTIAQNRADREGSIFFAGGSSGILGSTITQNQASQGAGLLNRGATVSVTGSIVAGNRATTAPDVSGQFQDGAYNVIGVKTGSTGFTRTRLAGTAAAPLDPKLTPLTRQGLTVTYGLQPDSPAIDQGVASGYKVDQRGQPRIQGRQADVGSVEFPLPISSPTPTPTPTPIDPVLVDPPVTIVPPLTPDLPIVPSSSAPPPVARPTPPETRRPAALILPVERPTHQTSHSAIATLDRALSADYDHYFGQRLRRASQSQDSPQQFLQRLKQERQVGAAIVYAVFVSPALTPTSTTSQSATSIAEILTSAGRSRIPHPDDRLELIGVFPNGQMIRRSLSVTREQVTEQAKLFRLTVSDPEDAVSPIALGNQLYEWLLEPLEAEMQQQQISHLIYAMDTGLRTIPVAAMRDEHGYVLDRYAMSVIPSFELMDTQMRPFRDQRFLAMGAERFQDLTPLPAVPMELQQIGQNLQKGQSFLNEDFTLSQLTGSRSHLRPTVIHLATHAQFRPGKPNQSFIQLWDSQMTLDQIGQLNWHQPAVDLLVLSACTTAIGSAEAELGFAGIAAASGVRTTVGSLWAVSDIGTLALMSEFYRQLGRVPTRSQALRAAQRALMTGQVSVQNSQLRLSDGTLLPLPQRLADTPISGDFTHPFYWSAFTLIGNPW